MKKGQIGYQAMVFGVVILVFLVVALQVVANFTGRMSAAQTATNEPWTGAIDSEVFTTYDDHVSNATTHLYNYSCAGYAADGFELLEGIDYQIASTAAGNLIALTGNATGAVNATYSYYDDLYNQNSTVRTISANWAIFLALAILFFAITLVGIGRT